MNSPTQAKMVTFEDVVFPRPIITNTDAIWTDRTPVKPRALDVRHQLPKMTLCHPLVVMVMRISCSAPTIS